MADMTTFEQQLSARLESGVAGQVGTFDAAQIAARALAARRSPWDRLLNNLRAGEALPMRNSRRVALLAMTGLLVLGTVALAIGASKLGGPRLALLRPNGDLVDLVVANADGSDQQVIGRFPYSPLRSELSWAPGGENLALFGEDWQLTVVDRGGRVVFQRKLEDRGSQFAWSPDGQRIAIFDGGWLADGPDSDGGPPVVRPHLDVVSANGQLEWSAELPDALRYAAGLGGVAWSRDGRQLAISGFLSDPERPAFATQTWRSSIWIVDAETRSVRLLQGDDGPEGDYAPAWLPDGRILVMRQSVGLVAIEPATGVESVAYTFDGAGRAGFMSDWSVSPDGSRVVLVAPNIGLAVLDLATGAVQEIPQPPDPNVGSGPPVKWNPDGTALLVRAGAITDEPFFATQLAQIEIPSGAYTVLATNVVGYGVQN